MRKLPSLNGLRAFEAAARLGSFTAAANELNVTQTAVSRLVRELEARLGKRLFERRANGLSLTEAGATYAPALSAAFDRILAATEALTSQQRGVLTVACGPTFAMRWLIPRLPRFHALHPDIEVRLSTSLPVAEGAADDLLPPGVSAAIRIPGQALGSYRAEPLFTADLFPVCAPGLAARLQQPQDLLGAPLLHVRHAPGEWAQWLAAAGVGQGVPDGGLQFDFHAFALQAAIDGLGVALAGEPFVMDDLAAGRLVAPFAVRVPKKGAWSLIYRPEQAGQAAFVKFQSWLKASLRPGSSIESGPG